jgi:hypothetical protein
MQKTSASEDPMVKQQMELRLNAEIETEAEGVWRSMPPGSRQQVVQYHAWLIGRASKLAALTRRIGASDEHTEASHGR